MPFSTQCLECGSRIKVPNSHAGRVIACPKCKEQVEATPIAGSETAEDQELSYSTDDIKHLSPEMQKTFLSFREAPARRPRPLVLPTRIDSRPRGFGVIIFVLQLVATVTTIWYYMAGSPGHYLDALLLTYLLNFASVIWAALHSSGRGAETAVWCLVILFFPLVGLFVYLIATD